MKKNNTPNAIDIYTLAETSFKNIFLDQTITICAFSNDFLQNVRIDGIDAHYSWFIDNCFKMAQKALTTWVKCYLEIEDKHATLYVEYSTNSNVKTSLNLDHFFSNTENNPALKNQVGQLVTQQTETLDTRIGIQVPLENISFV